MNKRLITLKLLYLKKSTKMSEKYCLRITFQALQEVKVTGPTFPIDTDHSYPSTHLRALRFEYLDNTGITTDDSPISLTFRNW